MRIVSASKITAGKDARLNKTEDEKRCRYRKSDL
jgi:hypothetical protein